MKLPTGMKVALLLVALVALAVVVAVRFPRQLRNAYENGTGRQLKVVTLPKKEWTCHAVMGDISPHREPDRPTIAINGSYFTEKLQPEGLLISMGKELAPVSDKPIYSGFLIHDDDGLAITTATARATRAFLAVQSGPILVEGGVNGIAPGGPKADRTVVGLNDESLFIISANDISLHELADRLIALGVRQAINLDGGPSTALVARMKDFTYTKMPATPIAYHLLFHRGP